MTSRLCSCGRDLQTPCMNLTCDQPFGAVLEGYRPQAIFWQWTACLVKILTTALHSTHEWCVISAMILISCSFSWFGYDHGTSDWCKKCSDVLHYIWNKRVSQEVQVELIQIGRTSYNSCCSEQPTLQILQPSGSWWEEYVVMLLRTKKKMWKSSVRMLNGVQDWPYEPTLCQWSLYCQPYSAIYLHLCAGQRVPCGCQGWWAKADVCWDGHQPWGSYIWNVSSSCELPNVVSIVLYTFVTFCDC